MGSMCSKEGMSIFMGKPGRYRFPLLGSREAEGQKPVRGTCSPFPLIPPLSPPRESPGLCSLQAPPLPSPLLSARLLGPFPPILLQTLELNCICQDYDSQAAQPSPHSRPFMPFQLLPQLSVHPHLSPGSAQGAVLVKANFLSDSISSKLLTSIMRGKPGA